MMDTTDLKNDLSIVFSEDKERFMRETTILFIKPRSTTLETLIVQRQEVDIKFLNSRIRGDMKFVFIEEKNKVLIYGNSNILNVKATDYANNIERVYGTAVIIESNLLS